MFLQEILNRFDNVKKTGSDQYSCRCPAHNDKSNSLGIAEKDGNILINCFAGCSVQSILDATNLKWKDILSSDNEMEMQITKTFNPYAVLKHLRDEVLIIGLSSVDIRNGKSLNNEDHERLMLAISNIRSAYAKCK
ncbi:MAG: DNA primase [Methylophilaceae bacterium]|nr:DNA primase [Methylophilaceae bacterium]